MSRRGMVDDMFFRSTMLSNDANSASAVPEEQDIVAWLEETIEMGEAFPGNCSCPVITEDIEGYIVDAPICEHERADAWLTGPIQHLAPRLLVAQYKALEMAHAWIKEQDGSFCSDGLCVAGPAGTPHACALEAALSLTRTELEKARGGTG